MNPLVFNYNSLHSVRLSDLPIELIASVGSKAAWKKAIKAKRVMLNGVLGSSGDWVNKGDELSVKPAEPKNLKPTGIDLEILFEDAFLAVINKPAGLPVSANKHRTVANALPENITISNQPDALPEPHPVHRLDYATSGCLIVAKTAQVETQLMHLFANHEIDKTYAAVAIGNTENSFDINATIDNKPSFTRFTTLASIVSDKFNRLNFLSCHPTSGRRHQIRKHLLANKTPILGDKLYYLPNGEHGGKGLYLHAWKVSFQHPAKQQTVAITCPLPKKFTRIFESLKEQ